MFRFWSVEAMSRGNIVVSNLIMFDKKKEDGAPPPYQSHFSESYDRRGDDNTISF